MSPRIIWHILEPSSAAARYPRELITALTAEGIPIHLVCPRNYRFREELGRNPLVTLHLTTARSVDIKRGLLAKVWTNACFLGSSAYVLARTCRRGSLVHFQHTLHFPFAAAFFVCARLRRATIVFTVHDPVPHKWLFSPRLQWIERRTLAWAYRVSDTLIVHSEPGKAALTGYFNVKPGKIEVIGRGPYGLGAGLIGMPGEGRLEVLFFGSIRENKGVHLAIEAVQELYRRGVAIRLTIAGEVANGNESAYWRHCRELIAKSPEPILVRNEFVADDALAGLIATCHCFLLPYTTFFSDSGVAFLALANGRPILSTRAGGLGPLLDATQAGVEIEPCTVQGVREALARAARLPVSELARLGERGAEYVNNQMAWRKVAHRTREVYAVYLPFLRVNDQAPPLPSVIVHTPEPTSGAARYVWELVSALAAKGIEVHLVCPENFQFRKELESSGRVRLHLTRMRAVSNVRNLATRVLDNLSFAASSLAWLARTGRRGSLVHFQFVFHFPAGVLFFLLARLCGLKIVFTVHDPIPHRWLLPRRFRVLERGALALAYRLSHRLIAHSQAGKKTLIEEFHLDPDAIAVIAHGPYDLGQGALPMPADIPLELLAFGAIRENKGLHFAIEAVQALDSQSERVCLTIAGCVLNASEQPYWRGCLQRIARNPNAIRVIEEFIPDERLPRLFADCHAVLLPYTEFCSDSGVALMALTNGRPVIATASGGLGALMSQADVGFPIDTISVEGVIDAIRSALRAGIPELRRKAQNGIAVANLNGGWPGAASETLAVYRSLCDRQPLRDWQSPDRLPRTDSAQAAGGTEAEPNQPEARSSTGSARRETASG